MFTYTHPIHLVLTKVTPPIQPFDAVLANGGLVTGHIEFDIAIAFFVGALLSAALLIPEDGPRGWKRTAVRILILGFCAAGIISAILGFRAMLGFR